MEVVSLVILQGAVSVKGACVVYAKLRTSPPRALACPLHRGAL